MALFQEGKFNLLNINPVEVAKPYVQPRPQQLKNMNNENLGLKKETVKMVQSWLECDISSNVNYWVEYLKKAQETACRVMIGCDISNDDALDLLSTIMIVRESFEDLIKAQESRGDSVYIVSNS
jgi:hypothetical protein